jgi:hypothetical protein
MHYIDKSLNSKIGTAIVDDFLDKCWNGKEYHAANYATFSKPEFRNSFVDVLLDEQKNLCCYCMKELQNDHKTTLEHIIPQNIKNTSQFNEYLTFKELGDNVINKIDFDQKNKVIPPLKYPHDLSFHNLIASCDSKANCNNKRKDEYIKPLIYDRDIQFKVEYDRKGQAFSLDYFDELETLGVSTNKNLILFRWIWAEISKMKDIDVNSINEETIEEILLTLEYPQNFESIIENFFDNPSKKPDLLKYKWFYNYFKNETNS